MSIKFKEVREANLYGYEATRPDGSMRVEVLRIYSGMWSVFTYLAGDSVPQYGKAGRQTMPFQTAMSEARKLIQAETKSS